MKAELNLFSLIIMATFAYFECSGVTTAFPVCIETGFHLANRGRLCLHGHLVGRMIPLQLETLVL